MSVEEFLRLRNDDIFDVIFCLNDEKIRGEIDNLYKESPGADIEERNRKWSRFIDAWIDYDFYRCLD